MDEPYRGKVYLSARVGETLEKELSDIMSERNQSVDMIKGLAYFSCGGSCDPDISPG